MRYNHETDAVAKSIWITGPEFGRLSELNRLLRPHHVIQVVVLAARHQELGDSQRGYSRDEFVTSMPRCICQGLI